MEALARYDRNLVVGILGGSAGTTFDAFQMLWEAKKYGARVALYGRKINNAEHQLSFVRYLRAVADDQIDPKEAVARITAISRNSASRRIVRWKKTFSRPRRPAAIADRAVRARNRSRPSPPEKLGPKSRISARCHRPRRISGISIAGSGSWDRGMARSRSIK